MIHGLKSQSIQIIFLGILLLAISVFFYSENISLFPSFIHAWTQSDRYALALGFLNNGFDFFHPQTYNLATADGITRVDFPIHEYLVALIMKVTGNHDPVVFRVYILFYALVGLIFLYRLSSLFISGHFRSMLVPVFIFLCPVFLYYADGFIPSIPSLSNLFIGYYFYFRYKKSGGISSFGVGIFFLTLSALCRLPFFIFLFAVLIQQVIDSFREKKISRNEIIIAATALIVFSAYQVYNAWLGKKYGTQFLVSFLPAADLTEAITWIRATWSHWRFQYFTLPHYAILGLFLSGFILHFMKERKLPEILKMLFLQTIIATSGCFIYFMLMLQQFPDHDYYFIDAGYPVVTLVLILSMTFSFPGKFRNYTFNLLVTLLLISSLIRAKEILEKRYETTTWDRVEITRKNFTGADKYLDQHGIPANAKVLVLDGYTTNVPLMLMNRKGWTVNWTTKEKLDSGLSLPFDLVAIQNCFIASDVVRNAPAIVTRLEKFGDNGLVSFYTRKENKDRSLETFLGIDSLHLLWSSSEPENIDVDSASEFFDLFTDTVSKFSSALPLKVFVTGKISCNHDVVPDLVAAISGRDNTGYYFSFVLRDYTNNSKGWQNLTFQFVLPPAQNPSDLAKIYFWNKRKASYSIAGLRLSIYR